jgi:hypothetical protein
MLSFYECFVENDNSLLCDAMHDKQVEVIAINSWELNRHFELSIVGTLFAGFL